MEQQVSIILRSGERFDIPLTDAELSAKDPGSARFFVAELFAASGLEMPNPVGKILLVDQVLLLAQEVKPANWAQPDAALREFLAAAVAALGRGSLTIDLQNYRL